MGKRGQFSTGIFNIEATMIIIVKTKANIAARACEIELKRYKIPSLKGGKIELII